MAINDISLTAGMRSNLLSLQGTVDLLNRTQSRLSSGKKVSSALDNPVSYFASQALTSRASLIDGLKDAMGQAVQTITAADKGITAISSMIEQAKGIAQSALSADAGLGTETVTLNGVTAGDTINIGGTLLTAGPSSVATTTTINNFTIDIATNADVGDTVNVGGVSFTATAASTVNYTQFSLDLNVNTLVAGNTVTVGGVSYSAVASSFTTAYDGYAVNLAAVTEGDTVTVGGVTYTASTGEGGLNFKSDGTDAAAALSLKARIAAVQGGVWSGAESGAVLTISSPTPSNMLANSVTASAAVVTTQSHQVDTTALTLQADEFVISGNAGMDASNLRAAINGLQGANFTAGGAGATVTIVAAGSTVMDAGTVALAPAAGIVTSVTTTSTPTNLGQFQFAIGADKNATAASLAGKMQTFFGTQLGVANASSSSVITITAGTSALTGNTVTAGTDADHDITIASSTTVTTSNVYADGYFAVTGNNTTDAATLSNAINSAAITGFSATASNGVLTIANSTASVAAGDVVVSNATRMAETMIAAGDDTELASLQAQYSQMLTQINTIAVDSGYKGKNLLDGDVLTVKFEGSHSLVITGFSVANDLGIGQAAAWNAGGNVDADITKLDTALVTLRSESSKLSGNLSIISVRQDFSTNMINTLTAGSDKLVLADANEEGANMLMLQTRQSLSTTALSLSAQAAQSVLKLFG